MEGRVASEVSKANFGSNLDDLMSIGQCYVTRYLGNFDVLYNTYIRKKDPRLIDGL